MISARARSKPTSRQIIDALAAPALLGMVGKACAQTLPPLAPGECIGLLDLRSAANQSLYALCGINADYIADQTAIAGRTVALKITSLANYTQIPLNYTQPTFFAADSNGADTTGFVDYVISLLMALQNEINEEISEANKPDNTVMYIIGIPLCSLVGFLFVVWCCWDLTKNSCRGRNS